MLQHFSSFYCTERPTCVCWIWRNGETSKVKRTHQIPRAGVYAASKYKPHTIGPRQQQQQGPQFVHLVKIRRNVCRPPAYNSDYAQCHPTNPSYVSGTRATLLDRTFPGWPDHQLAIAIMPPQPRWCHYLDPDPGRSFTAFSNRLCPIQCVFIFLHVSCQASYTMSAIGFCWINIFPNSLL